MKKVIVSTAVMAVLGLGSCGTVDPDKLADDICGCIEKEGEEKTKCIDDWVKEYKDAKILKDDVEEAQKKIQECGALNDPDVATAFEKLNM